MSDKELAVKYIRAKIAVYQKLYDNAPNSFWKAIYKRILESWKLALVLIGGKNDEHDN